MVRVSRPKSRKIFNRQMNIVTFGSLCLFGGGGGGGRGQPREA